LSRILSLAFRLLVPVVVLAIAAPPAQAAPAADPRTEARNRFDRGLRLYDDGDVPAALAEFKRAYELLPRPQVLYNMAQSYAALGDPVQATAALDTLLADKSTPADTRERASRLLREQAPRVAEVNVIASVNGAHIEVDNLESGVTPLNRPLRVASGNHVIGLFAPGYAPSRTAVTVAGGTRSDVRFDLVPNEARLAHLTVVSTTPDATVAANGQVLGKTPLSASLTLLPGRYSVELRRPGYHPAHSDVTLGDGATGEVHLDLEEDAGRSAEGDGILRLAPSEPGSVVILDGKLRGEYGAPISAPAGRHRLRLEHAGFLPSDHEVALAAGSTTRLSVHLYPTNETRASYESSARTRRILGWIVTGAGAALAVGSTVYVIGNRGSVNSAQTQFDSITARSVKGSGQDCDPSGGHATLTGDECLALYDSASSRLDDAHLRQNLGIAGIGVGAAAAVIGVVLLVTGDDPHRYDHEPAARLLPRAIPFATWTPAGSSFGLQGTF
jgi:hypothetical protein